MSGGYGVCSICRRFLIWFFYGSRRHTSTYSIILFEGISVLADAVMVSMICVLFFVVACIWLQIPVDEKEKTAMKVIVTGKAERVVGIHVIGMGADEMMQGFGVAMKVGESCHRRNMEDA